MANYCDELLNWSLELESAWEKLRENHRFNGNNLVFEKKLEQLLSMLRDEKYKNDFVTLSHYANELYEWWNNEHFRINGKDAAVPIGGHTLPPLPYAYDSLEPYIAKEIMELHHKIHHQAYVDGLNKAEMKLKEARNKNDYELVKHWSKELAFHGAGHYLHSIFWNNMSPKGGGEPIGELTQQINQDFGSFEKFKEHFSQAAEKVEGVGWAMLVYSPRSHRLEILQVEKHQNLSQQDIVPILVLDVWEHAYYLQYKTDKKGYIKNWWNVVNWKDANSRFFEAKKLRWTPY